MLGRIWAWFFSDPPEPPPPDDPPALRSIPGWEKAPELPAKMRWSDLTTLYREIWRQKVALERRVAELEKKNADLPPPS